MVSAPVTGEVLDGDALGRVDLGCGEPELLDDRQDLVVRLHLGEDVVELVADVTLILGKREGPAAELLLAVDDREEALGCFL